MNKHEAEATARQMEAAGFTVTGYRRKGRGEWFVEALDNANGETVTIYSAGQWGLMAGWMNATAPQPGARLKRPELATTPQPGARLKYNEPTQQVSITVPVSVLAAADAGGRGKRSAWFVAAARAWMAREGE